MKITQLYSHHPIPYVTIFVSLVCIIITGISRRFPELYHALAWKRPADTFWQYLGGAFLHGTDGCPRSMVLGHLMGTQLMFLPMAVLLENTLGHGKFTAVFLLAWLGSSLSFQIIAAATSQGENAYGAGLSGIAYAMIALGFWVLLQVFLKDKAGFLRQPLAWFLSLGFLGELAALSPALAGMGSTLIHLSGLIVGAVLAILFRGSLVV